MATQSHVEVHKFEQFKANVQDLLGEHPAHSVVSHLCMEEMGAGKGVWIDGIDSLDSADATTAALTAKATREGYYNTGTETWDAYKATKTPHMAVDKIRTQSLPQLNEWGHYFDEDEGWQHLVDPKGKEVNVGVRKLHKTRDELFGTGVVAPSVSRTSNASDTLASVVLPSTQIVADLKYSEVTIETLPSVICEKFDDVWFAKGSPIYCCISSTLARHFRANSRSQIHSNDFVRSYENFRTGDIPEIDGVTFVVMPNSYMSQFSGIASPTKSGTFTAIAPGGGERLVSFTDVAHGLLAGEAVTIAGDTAWDGTYDVVSVTADTFVIESAVSGATDTGTWTSGGATAIDNWFSWCPQAITKVSYKPMKVSEGISPDHRFDTAVYAREKVDFVRTDDRGVVVGDIISA